MLEDHFNDSFDSKVRIYEIDVGVQDHEEDLVEVVIVIFDSLKNKVSKGNSKIAIEGELVQKDEVQVLFEVHIVIFNFILQI